MRPFSIVTGTLSHRRLVPGRHHFRHKQYMLLLDVEKLLKATSLPWPIKYNKAGILSISDKSFLDGSSISLSRRILEKFQGFTPVVEGETMYILASPSLFGYGFNPASFYFKLNHNGVLNAAIVEVHNTFNESHTYCLDIDDSLVEPKSVYKEKGFHVSPFLQRRGSYEFDFLVNKDTVNLSISLWQDDVLVIETTYAGDVSPLTSRNTLFNLTGMLICVLLTEIRILMHAFKLKFILKLPFYSKPTPKTGTVESPSRGIISRLRIPFL